MSKKNSFNSQGKFFSFVIVFVVVVLIFVIAFLIGMMIPSFHGSEKESDFDDSSFDNQGNVENPDKSFVFDLDNGSENETMIPEGNFTCGDGFIDGNEECDDGDLGNGDGCSSICEVESGFACYGGPSFCTALTPCSDGIDNDGDGNVDWGYSGNDLDCDSPFDTSESFVIEEINWGEFPEFELRDDYDLFYWGIKIRDDSDALKPLDHGFTHIFHSRTTQSGRDSLPIENRVILWTGIPAPCRSSTRCPPSYIDQPWENAKSPWGNNMEEYEGFWRSRLRNYARKFTDTDGMDLPDVDLIVLDVEQKWTKSEIIDNFRNSGLYDDYIPKDIRMLSDKDFYDSYIENIVEMYYAPMLILIDDGFSGKISTYSETGPIERTWWSIDNYDWETWTSDYSRLSYLVTGGGESFNDVYSYSEVFNPSAYYFYDYPGEDELDKSESLSQWNNAGKYLAYMLFQGEVNREWTDKPIIVWQWIDSFHSSTEYDDDAIRSHMAHASAIFPYFSDIDGVAIWGDSDNVDRSEIYQDYLYGLYRLSRYNYFFDGNYGFYAPENARDLYTDMLPVLRGVVNEGRNELLVAAHNPFAEEDELTEFVIEYEGNVLGSIEVNGLNTYLGVCDLDGGGCVGDEGLIDSYGDFDTLSFSQDKDYLFGEEETDRIGEEETEENGEWLVFVIAFVLVLVLLVKSFVRVKKR